MAIVNTWGEPHLSTLETFVLERAKQGVHLSTEAKRLIKNPCEYGKIDIIDTLTRDERKEISDVFYMSHLKHYNDIQVNEWFRVEKRLLANAMQIDVNQMKRDYESALMAAWSKHGNSERYRLWYALSFTGSSGDDGIPHVYLNEDKFHNPKIHLKTIEFLNQADAIRQTEPRYLPQLLSATTLYRQKEMSRQRKTA